MFIRPSKSPFFASVIMVPKKDGSFRLCVENRALNNITVKNRGPLPGIYEALDQLNGASLFSKIDLRSAYHQVRIKDGDIPKIAFNTRYEHFEFTVLAFGLTNVPATFQTLMKKLFHQHLDKFVIFYLDDILVYSKSLEKHHQHARKVLKILQDHKLYANPGECIFFAREVEFVGFILSNQGIGTDPVKVNAIQDWPTPRNATEVQSFMGLANYYRWFIPAFSKLSIQLTNLTKSSTKYISTPTCQEAFDNLKQAVCSSPVLQFLDFSKPFRIMRDYSGQAVGAVLLQNQDHEGLPVAYESRKLNDAARKYAPHEGELLVLIHALKIWRHYLLGSHVNLYTDHRTLQYFQNQPHISGRRARWIETLQEFDVTIHYLKRSR